VGCVWGRSAFQLEVECGDAKIVGSSRNLTEGHFGISVGHRQAFKLTGSAAIA